MTEKMDLWIAFANPEEATFERLTREVDWRLAAEGLKQVPRPGNSPIGTVWVEGTDPNGRDRPSVQVDYDNDRVFHIQVYVEPIMPADHAGAGK